MLSCDHILAERVTGNVVFELDIMCPGKTE